MIKPQRLKIGDTVAMVSPSWGCAGDAEVKWKYDLGVKRLTDLGLQVVSAPNALRGETFLENNPLARAEDVMWAFENKDVKAIICNIGGNDSERLIPYLSADSIISNPKIFCGYSDAMSLHLYFRRLGLMTFYGDNLLTTIAEAERWHPYSQYWFEKCFFDGSVIGEIIHSETWSPDANDHTDNNYLKTYVKNTGYQRVQGKGVARGRLLGGHGVLLEYCEESPVRPTVGDFENKILFFEDIPEVMNVSYMGEFFEKLATNGYLQVLSGIIIGKICSHDSFEPYADKIRSIVSEKCGLADLPILYGLNFGHSNPICILPYEAEAELDVEHLRFSILESGVL